jgi:hypothetical protein
MTAIGLNMKEKYIQKFVLNMAVSRDIKVALQK